MSIDIAPVDLTDSRNFIGGVPYEWFAWLRRNAPAYWHEEADGAGFWAVTRHEDCVAVNRDAQRFSSARKGTFLWDLAEEQLEQQRLMMVTMDPPMHTRYRRLVNKGFTPRTIAQLEQRIHVVADEIIDAVAERGRADFVIDIAAELPLVVLAELLGVPAEDREKMFDWSNRMIGREDAEYLGEHASMEENAAEAAAELFGYAAELYEKKRLSPREDLMSVLSQVELDGEQLSELELDLFFMLLAVAGNETTRNLMSGAMVAFSQFPDQWERLRADRSLLPSAVEEMLRFVTPVMNFRRQATEDTEIAGQRIAEGDKVVFFHASANRDEAVFDDPDRFDIGRSPNPHMAFGGGGPHFCLGANLARMEIVVMFEHLLDRLPDLHVAGEVERLQSNFINGVKHLPVAFTPVPRVGAAAS
ncbi:MAG TPA: cytochrome P450 [Acidimicrobiales bacterium]|nr:cytochrome P450 [Acidimicrobiales bacterium]